MNTNSIKKAFLDFFKKNGYIEKQPSNLVLENDKSLLFTNSGMVQFKNIFLGLENAQNAKVTTIQPCIRLGGKHNDLDNIGKTPHHNTSFDMLGNFGFGEVGKDEAINLAINFLTENLQIEKKHIYVTINKDDIETLKIWSNYINKEKIIHGSHETNFWQMAENGPCGYCSEIFYNINHNEDKKNLLEMWNLVFINFNKQHNKLTKLKKTYIDTGMGLERIASIKQNVFDNFKTDIYKPLIQSTITSLQTKEDENNTNIRIITDHIKTCIMLINENVMPSNDGRGYILKKLIRRSIIKKQELKTQTKLYNLIDDFIKYMPNYSIESASIIKKIIKNEELKFENTIKNGQLFIKKLIQNKKQLSGKTLFTLYDTYGTPIDTIEMFLKENNLKTSISDFKKEMENQIKQNKIKSKKTYTEETYTKNIPCTIFEGYEKYQTNTIILKIIKNNIESDILLTNDTGIIITKNTSFYAEKGGQTGDSGTIENYENIFDVKTTKEFNNIHLHYGKMKSGVLKKNDTVQTKINLNKRKLIANNHSATHLLHAALKNILGKHIAQAGSLINDAYLRFDFIHFNHLSKNEKNDIEILVNKNIKDNLNVIITFDTTNIEKNRIIKIGDNTSIEPCAGTHVQNTSELGLFKIIKEYGIGNNIRRIEAITNYKIIETLEETDSLINELTHILKTEKTALAKKIKILIEKNNKLALENHKLMNEKIKNTIHNTPPIKITTNINLVIINEKLDDFPIQKIINYFKNTIIINLLSNNDKTLIKIIITNDITHISAIYIINNLIKNIQCLGGGNDKIANGIIYKKIENTDIIKYLHLLLNT